MGPLLMSESKKPSLLRRQFIVDRRFQVDMLLRAGLFCALLLIVLGVGVFYPLIQAIESGRDADDAVATMLYMHQHFWPVALLCVFLAMVVSVQITHRIAGPLFRLKDRLTILGRGEFPRVVMTRKNDYLKSEILILNDAIEAIAVATDEIKAAESEVVRELEVCFAGLSDLERDRMSDAIARVEQKAAILHEKIHYFRRCERRHLEEDHSDHRPVPRPSLYEQPILS